ncbi:hypothetical protein BV25DRAFT_1843530 [Artomyces pyxidatus]|uniref:Uncharacterized protein n=1 Tax=Artomyces pyxidatus TaxID=48021 RepID=A0ACB8SDU9_9AGAM|nr:hypothetical protein BV25DRAFT_1843530 [Artomyces pyxidatus]
MPGFFRHYSERNPTNEASNTAVVGPRQILPCLPVQLEPVKTCINREGVQSAFTVEHSTSCEFAGILQQYRSSEAPTKCAILLSESSGQKDSMSLHGKQRESLLRVALLIGSAIAGMTEHQRGVKSTVFRTLYATSDDHPETITRFSLGLDLRKHLYSLEKPVELVVLWPHLSGMSLLSSLPNDILLEILEDLDWRDLIACKRTCHRLDTLVGTAVLLHYTIELAACGMLDGERGRLTLPIRERLDRLKQHREAWRNLTWTEPTISPTSWVGLTPPILFARSVDNDEYFARQPATNTHRCTTKAVCNSHGELLFSIVARDYWSIGTEEYQSRNGWFLNESYILLDLFTSDATAARPIQSPSARCLVVVPISLSDARSYRFFQPEFFQDLTHWSHRIIPWCTGDVDQGYFYADPEDRLLSLRPSTPGSSLSSQFVIDIPVRTFTEYIQSHPEEDGAPVVVPWEEWGPRGARITLETGTGHARWPRTSVHGMRQLSVREDALRGSVTVLDYHPRRVARALARGDAQVVHGGSVGGVVTLLPCIETTVPLPEGPARSLAAGRMLGAWLCKNGVLFVEVRDFSVAVLYFC